MLRTFSSTPSFSIASMFASAIAEQTGWPANVNPCVKLLMPCMNGSATRSVAITAPIGAYALVIPFAVVIRSGT